MAVRILFIGNSFTLRNQLPRLLRELAAATEPPIEIDYRMVMAGGASLRRHWNAGIAQAALAQSPFDFVVLQEQSTLPLKNPQRYHENVRLFDPLIAQHGARTVLYLTWSRRHVPDAQADLTRAVQDIAAETSAHVVPVGVVWHEALARDPGLALYAEDGSHPTATGSYLAACVFLVSLFDRRPNGWSVSDALKIDRATAETLHALAWSARERATA
jgi:hypothetical protein